MNSEISNVVKISPVTVVKTGKQAEDRTQTAVTKLENGLFVANPNSASEDSIHTAALAGQTDNQKNESKPDAEMVKRAIDQGNTLLQAVKRNLQFKVDDATKEMVVKIVDSNSGEVVKQIPSEEMLDFVKRMQELEGQQGSVIQDRA